MIKVKACTPFLAPCSALTMDHRGLGIVDGEMGSGELWKTWNGKPGCIFTVTEI